MARIVFTYSAVATPERTRFLNSPFPIRPFVGPSRVLAGSGSATHVPAELRAIGAFPEQGAILLVGDGVVLDLGLVEPIQACLEAAGFRVVACAPITGEPTPAMVGALTPANQSGPVAAVVGVGGGSALDASKLLALSIANELDWTAGLFTTADVVPGPPVAAIPTTAGTGAEATSVAMLWHEQAKLMFVHAHLVPRLALLDPELVVHLPRAITASAGLDAISHAVESLLSTFRTPLTESAARAALAALTSSLESAYATGDTPALGRMLLGAHQAGLALNASVVLGHSIAYTIAARTGLPHGVTCAMALPYCLAHARSACEYQISEMAEIVCDVAEPERFVKWLLDANAAMEVPASLEEVGIGDEALPEIARECIERYPRTNHPVEIEPAGLESLLERFLQGDGLGAWHDAVAGSPVRSHPGGRE